MYAAFMTWARVLLRLKRLLRCRVSLRPIGKLVGIGFQRNAGSLVGHSRVTRPRKPDSGHTGIISITLRARRASRNAMKPQIQCVLTQWNPGFIAFGQGLNAVESRFHCVRQCVR